MPAAEPSPAIRPLPGAAAGSRRFTLLGNQTLIGQTETYRSPWSSRSARTRNDRTLARSIASCASGHKSTLRADRDDFRQPTQPSSSCSISMVNGTITLSTSVVLAFAVSQMIAATPFGARPQANFTPRPRSTRPRRGSCAATVELRRAEPAPVPRPPRPAQHDVRDAIFAHEIGHGGGKSLPVP